MVCDCYHVIEEKPGKFSGECWGTKERDRVNCSGYTELCSNGLKKSKPDTPVIGLMYTAKMVIEAARTHKTYKSGDVLFNTAKGFLAQKMVSHGQSPHLTLYKRFLTFNGLSVRVKL